ncbi:FAD-dependent oxidoreductase [Geodermatophilus sp. YIM 151500]|uniref:FAD-dependent oxidoreductase n=1 Tax=Geodermatophilus sp. YIM 151500 TaxID=2984531 RepID=UPI0021E47602|nr:FAD-dependent oxidoreductase [Geodermatophilus sp. YIM 151500]MCV2489304.1 FAD-dependent oxidoreductase [Geodermatophilus sp. YIM 151500]
MTSAAGIPAEEVDILVIGGGGSGLATAVRAAQRGARVLVVEKRDRVGGSTALSVGSITAAGTRLQRRAGVQDSPQAFLEDMYAFRPELLEGDAPDLRRLLADEAAATVSWLEELGVAFVGPYPEPPHRVPRMHNVIPNSRSYIARLSAAAERLGVAVRLGTTVGELVVEGGRVTGAVVHGADGDRRVRAGRGVVLASGDFSGNRSMREAFLPPAAAAARPINPHANGDGHRLAQQIGAELRAMDVTFGPQLRFPPPPRTGLIDRLPTWSWLCRVEAFLVQRLPAAALRPFVKSLLITHMSPASTMFEAGAVLVNKHGERFGSPETAVTDLAFQEDGLGYIVFDGAIAQRFNTPPHSISTAPGIAFAYFDDYRRGRPDLVEEATDISGLAVRIGVDSTSLEKSLADSGFTAPYFAMGPVLSMLTVTEGGLRVDGRLRVLTEDGTPVEGLHAVGGVGQGGMLLLGHGHHIGWAMTSGRLVAEALTAPEAD